MLTFIVMTRFQFHKGTIKTAYYAALRGDEFKFQFHKGTIKTTLQLKVTFLLLNFNSIKVQLKHGYQYIEISY